MPLLRLVHPLRSRIPVAVAAAIRRPPPPIARARYLSTSTISKAALGPGADLQPQPGVAPVTTRPHHDGEDGGHDKSESGDEDGATRSIKTTEEGKGRGGSGGGAGGGGNGGSGAHETFGGAGTAWKMFESAATTAASITVLGLAGYAYHKYYKYIVLKKIDNAFHEGDPALNLAMASHPTIKHEQEPWYSWLLYQFREPDKEKPPEGEGEVVAGPPGADYQHWGRDDASIHLDAQHQIDEIIGGGVSGHYYLLVGEKGTGKTSMLLRAMHQNKRGEHCSMMEAHADPEIFRLRLGKCLDFEFHEDYVGSLFSFRGPRETTAILDIERALNKLEKVAYSRKLSTGKPLVMIINGMHMIRDDEHGRSLLELLQQRAEAWAASGIVTMVFNSDDYWVYERMKQYGSRLELISVKDLSKPNAIKTLRIIRARKVARAAATSVPGFSLNEDQFEHVYEEVGGRLAFLTKVAKAKDMLAKCREIREQEKQWFLNKYWIFGMGMDDDVMDQQKEASSACLLMAHLVKMDNEHPYAHLDDGTHDLPEVPLHKAREVMTRADFIQQYDHDNVFTIDSRAMVRADSVPMMNAFRDIVNGRHEDGKRFGEWLEETMERIGDIESLGRTREVTLKDLWNGGKYKMSVKEGRKGEKEVMVEKVQSGRKRVQGDDGDEEEGDGKE